MAARSLRSCGGLDEANSNLSSVAVNISLPVCLLLVDAQKFPIFGGHFPTMSFTKDHLHGFNHGGRKRNGVLQRAALLGFHWDRDVFFYVHKV